MANYYTPGVYVEEISTLPPSIVEGSTAVPAFLGYTEKTEYNGTDRKLVPTRISTMLEFQQYFGGPLAPVVTAEAKETPQIVFEISTYTSSIYTLYYSLDLFFKNGGNYCYIVSLGEYSSPAKLDKKDFESGLKALEKEDEPTLIVMPDACGLDADTYYPICQEALAQCKRLKNRFCILDVHPSDADKSAANAKATADAKTPADDTTTPADDTTTPADDTTTPEAKSAVEIFRNKIGTENLQYGAAYYPFLKTSISPTIDETKITITGLKDANTFKDIKTKYTGLYSSIKNELNNPKYKVVLPASAAIAGVYASVDRDRGVWKAPANVGLNAVIEPVTKITAAEQDKLNVDATSGKSINAIRSFTGKGIIVWGARTLAGNDNEWRYVSVRRLFNLIEDSASKATFFAVFEPNDATTWLKVQSMIDSYLYSLWQQGALAGSTAKAAYFVKVGLGSTMTTQDILEGRMIIEIGVAAVRPAEFIILRFSHKLQEA